MHSSTDNVTKQSYSKRLKGLQSGLYCLECCLSKTPQTSYLSKEELWHKESNI